MRVPPVFNVAQNTKKLLEIETLVESFNTSARINQLLLARKERMTLGTNFNTDILFGGTCLNDIAASTCNGCILVCGMQILLHSLSPLY